MGEEEADEEMKVQKSNEGAGEESEAGVILSTTTSRWCVSPPLVENTNHRLTMMIFSLNSEVGSKG
jgi:hypothetical protein